MMVAVVVVVALALTVTVMVVAASLSLPRLSVQPICCSKARCASPRTPCDLGPQLSCPCSLCPHLAPAISCWLTA